MKHSNELDDFLREKEGEFNVPFEEKHWEKASAYLEAERRTTVLGNLTKGNLVLVAALLIGFIGAGSYFIFNNNLNKYFLLFLLLQLSNHSFYLSFCFQLRLCSIIVPHSFFLSIYTYFIYINDSKKNILNVSDVRFFSSTGTIHNF